MNLDGRPGVKIIGGQTLYVISEVRLPTRGTDATIPLELRQRCFAKLCEHLNGFFQRQLVILMAATPLASRAR
ncbi:hypothetical protein IVB46_42370 [Bradyrhizobium sp. 61]|uniref:hypothetical protein n=1 Tax=unclassified Bradyrhizobium TaxID=2631580 RepID=UPI001FFAFE7F|nr:MULTISPECIES: hypothetical protein [unclassified Bradyrhizobium]MCK1281878.1 hypothetical protein [Bradyrhizobium sp. 61]MCK1459774.1 hypothetical protein [Bradyrhizobium sp. 2]